MIILTNPACTTSAYKQLTNPRLGRRSLAARARSRVLAKVRLARFGEGPSSLSRRQHRKGLKPASVRKAEAEAKFARMQTREA